MCARQCQLSASAPFWTNFQLPREALRWEPGADEHLAYYESSKKAWCALLRAWSAPLNDRG